jgi:hypothetical protein
VTIVNVFGTDINFRTTSHPHSNGKEGIFNQGLKTF